MQRQPKEFKGKVPGKRTTSLGACGGENMPMEGAGKEAGGPEGRADTATEQGSKGKTL